MKISKNAKILIGVLLVLNISFATYQFALAPPPALGVDEVALDPGAYEGTIAIVGFTTNVYEDDTTLFGIKDLSELDCNAPDCDKPILPIRFQGTLPVLGDVVRVTGTFVQDGGKYYFNSEKVKVVENVKVGG